MNSSIKTLIPASLLALAGLCAPAQAQMPPNVVLENSVETTTDAVIFPAGLDGRVSVRNCLGCLHSTLQLDQNTSCILAGHTVSLREMAAYARQNVGKPLTISYRLSDLVVSRIAVLEK
ncbi:MAG: hypothetical protein KGL25_02260 [Gammaproteobacteria bacterium]|nr:hypothetical protein [Gammaproteobacteria bacterium]MDE2250216.1 hypothetical protein [Gammaproteobacteria bacterium]